MPYPRVKSEEYKAFGGINQKSSPADTSILEFLDISNMDFTSIGALQQRQGTSLFTAPGLSTGEVYGFFSFSGGIGQGFYSTQLITGSASFVGGPITSIYEFQTLNGASFILFSANGFFNYAGTSLSILGSVTLNQLYYSVGGTFNYLLDPVTKVIASNDNPINPNWSFKAFVNNLFFCNGDHFYKWDGSFETASVAQPFWSYYTSGTSVLITVQPKGPNVSKYCLPPGVSFYASATTFSGSSYTFNSMTFTYSYGFINSRGFRGPVSPPLTISGASLGFIALFGFSVAGSPPPSGFTFPINGYGVGATAFSDYIGSTAYSGGAYIAIYRDNGPGTGRYEIGVHAVDAPRLSTTVFNDFGFPTNTTPEPTCIFATLPPQYLEVYNNQLFMCGFSVAPSTVQFSDIGEPESVQPDNNFDFRTNDGDFLTGMKSAFSQLFLFKNRSFGTVSGTDPTNFAFNTISDQYGCLSNRAIATYQNYLMFLDEKGIILYNGALPIVASSKLDPIFAQMNINAAKNNAWMLHNKDRNQIWCGIPVNGSTLINQIIVYDYILNAWTHFDNVNSACAVVGLGQFAQRTVFFGGYTSQPAYFGSSLPGDIFTSGNTMTMYWQSRFVSDQGQSVEKIWRRLFLNTLSSQGATNLWAIALYANFASLPSVTFIQGGMSFQSRSDFGISAKNLSIRGTFSTNSDILSLTGFTIESRYQRNE